MTHEIAHIARAAAALDDPHAALNQHLHGDGDDSPHSMAGEIKPLCWFYDTESICTRAYAPALGGKMIVVELDPGSGKYSAGIDMSGLCFRLILDTYHDGFCAYTAPAKFPSIEAAKAAAQADYEARVSSSLSGPISREALVSFARPFADALLLPVTDDTQAAPGHTDLMVTPESLDVWLDDNPPPIETMAWAVAGEDGALTAINYDRRTARHLCGSGERVVRVAIRVVDDEVDAEVIADAPLVAPDVKPRNLVAQVEIGDGAVMSIPDPRAFEDGGLEWCLRYTCPDLPNNVQFQAASVVESYDYLLGPDITMKEAIDRLRIMRRARAALKETSHD